MDWSLYRCGGAGHVTYAPQEPAIRDHLRATTPAGDLWRCLRCGAFVAGPPDGTGPAAKAPSVRRGKEIRSQLILRLFAIDRFIRFVLFGGAAILIWQLIGSQVSIERAFDRELPVLRTLFRQMGYNIDHSSLVGLFQHALELKPHVLILVAIGAGAYAAIELVEGVGLWLARRWGEYFAMVATSLGFFIEVPELASKFTWTKLAFFVINLALVLYLVLSKRLFGLRGGKSAYEARLRSESVLEEAARAAAASTAASGASSGTAQRPATSEPPWSLPAAPGAQQ